MNAPSQEDTGLEDKPAPSRRSPVQLLVADDTEPVRLTVVRLLSRFLPGAQFTLATDGRNALRCIEEMLRSGSTFDVVLIDYNMPYLNGLQVLEEMRALQMQPVRAILMTSEPHPTLLRAAHEIGVEVLTKPFGGQEIGALAAKLGAPPTGHEQR